MLAPYKTVTSYIQLHNEDIANILVSSFQKVERELKNIGYYGTYRCLNATILQLETFDAAVEYLILDPRPSKKAKGEKKEREKNKANRKSRWFSLLFRKATKIK